MTSSAIIIHPDIQINGDVSIHPQAMVAPGVILQAAAGCHVAIAAGVCIGAGSIIQAHGGNIEIQNGAVLGAGCLIIGQGTIGANACIGYGSTIFYTSVPAAALLPPNSLLGDTSRQGTKTATQQPVRSVAQTQPEPTDPWQAENPPDPQITERRSPAADSAPVEPPPTSTTPEVIPTTPESIERTETTAKTPVVGQVYINQLLMTLFPHQNSLNRPKEPNGE